MSERFITINEAMTLLKDDHSGLINSKITDKNVVSLFEELPDGSLNPIFQYRPNIVVLRGRTFALERLFNDPIPANTVDSNITYVRDISRKIIAFGVGKGGAPASDPFSPFTTQPNGSAGMQLATQVPFRIHKPTASQTDPSQYIPSGEITNYGQGTTSNGTTTYTLKHFDNRVPEWVFNATENTVYKKIILKLTENDCRTLATNSVNELGLFIGREGAKDANGATIFTNVEMFSRITFPTELLDSGKKLTFEYRVYA